ncbi:2-oxo acid dehydrogenase subunit E2 [Streptomyces sp. RB6PN25]|uniref:Dihydrolipoamide acetyltransferase component of pyruvate dehydrogenase complex n=1 Tax=Streptomyces humicola TaxID=2953240 RepID=A0ABT1PZX2_9ACTN|nr:dihydrolipoamide acetyltransferase family protein [Streptomyces humicola]MCQ4083209.1 2-oxo acid dehydrogenase subunit E2 [Streptomyces humicola]
MAEVKEFTLPDLGEGLTEAEIVRWLVEAGDVVAVDQPVVEVETAKAVVEVPCPYGGVVTALFGAPGDEIPVGRPLLTVAVGAPEHADSGTQQGAGESGNVLVGYGTSAPAPRRRRARRAPAPAPTPAEAAAPTPAAAPAPPEQRAATHDGERPVAVVSPLVRRLAREHGIDLRSLHGSGHQGLILRSDVERAIAGARTHVEQRDTGEGTRIPLRGVRGAVAEKLARSRREIPDATCWVDADATELLAARAAMNATGPKVSVLALLARICTAALARYPELNATVDTERNEIVRLPAVHLGFAAQTERGLVVPVVRDAGARTTGDLSAEIARLTEAARTSCLTPAELTGSTFTLNNYGVFGVDGSTPIINHPEAAMLGVGRISPKPWVHEGELAVRHVVQLSFTFDHRVCDGGTAGGFLRFVADCVEHPATLLRNV